LDSSQTWVELKVLEVSQPIGTFYVGVISFKDVVRLSYSDVRRIKGESREVETYLGIERPLNRKRVAELKEYVGTLDASFPSSIILAIASEDTEYDPLPQFRGGTLRIKNEPDVAKVLDGQHRIAGLEDYDGDGFEVIVTLFVDMQLEDQAMIFATINLEQTKVNKSLAYDLYEYARERSPFKTAHDIVRLLDKREGSPFKGRIKVLGTAGGAGETLSQAQFVDALLPMISREPRKDLESFKRTQTPPRATPAEEQTLIFRNMFLDKRDAEIARVLWNYFRTVEQKWEGSWREVKKGNILNRTTGFRGLMQFLPFAYLSVGKPGDIPSEEAFSRIFSRVNLSGEQFTPENYPPGSSGPALLRNQLLTQTGLG